MGEGHFAGGVGRTVEGGSAILADGAALELVARPFHLHPTPLFRHHVGKRDGKGCRVTAKADSSAWLDELVDVGHRSGFRWMGDLGGNSQSIVKSRTFDFDLDTVLEINTLATEMTRCSNGLRRRGISLPVTQCLQIVVAIACALALWATACGPSSPPKVPPVDQGTTSIHLDNQLNGPVEVRKVRVSIDGKDAGGLAGRDLGRGTQEPLHVVTARLTEGAHTLTLHVQTVQKRTSDTLVLSETVAFSVGREPLSLVAKLSTPPDTSRVRMVFAMTGGTLAGPAGFHAPGSCHALPPGQTEICLTEEALRVAVEQRDAPRVVCLDETLREMRQVLRVSQVEDGGTSETILMREVPRRLEQLSRKARRCPSAKATTALLDAGL